MEMPYCKPSSPATSNRERRRPEGFTNARRGLKSRRHRSHQHRKSKPRSLFRVADGSRVASSFEPKSSLSRDGSVPSTVGRKAKGAKESSKKKKYRMRDLFDIDDDDDDDDNNDDDDDDDDVNDNGNDNVNNNDDDDNDNDVDDDDNDNDDDDTNSWSHLQRTRRSERQFIQSHRISTNNLSHMRELFYKKDSMYSGRRQISIDSSSSEGTSDDSREEDSISDTDNSDVSFAERRRNRAAAKQTKCPPCLRRRLKPRKVHNSPHIYVLDNFLTSSELDHLHKKIRAAEKKELFQKSFVDDSDDSSDGDCNDDDDDVSRKPKEGEDQKKKRRKKTQDRQRTSTFIHFAKMADSKIASIENRAADIFGMSNTCIEPLQLVRYLPGQHFGTHHDLGVYNEENETVILPKRTSLCPPRRVATLFVYLNDIPERLPLDGGRGGSLSCKGGCTFFPNANLLEVQPKRGRAVLWSNIDPDGNPDPRTIHSGLPITITHNPPVVSAQAEGPSGITNARAFFNPIYKDEHASSESSCGSEAPEISGTAASDFPLDTEMAQSCSATPIQNASSPNLFNDHNLRTDLSRDGLPLLDTISPLKSDADAESEQICTTHNGRRIKTPFCGVETTEDAHIGAWIANKCRIAISPRRLPLKKRKLVLAAEADIQERIMMPPTSCSSLVKDECQRETSGTSSRNSHSEQNKVSVVQNSKLAVQKYGSDSEDTNTDDGANSCSSDSYEENSDDDDDEHDEEWGFLLDLRKDNESTRQCMIKGCKNKAVALWATTGTPQRDFYYCESCQETDFGGWPGPEDYHPNSADRVVGSGLASDEGTQTGGFDLSEFLNSCGNSGRPPIVKYGINIWACEE